MRCCWLCQYISGGEETRNSAQRECQLTELGFLSKDTIGFEGGSDATTMLYDSVLGLQCTGSLRFKDCFVMSCACFAYENKSNILVTVEEHLCVRYAIHGPDALRLATPVLHMSAREV